MNPPLVLYLLDAEHMHPLQCWTFEGDVLIRIGRAPDNDVVFAHPGVSRSHAYMRCADGEWSVFSVSQQGLYYGVHRLMELALRPGMVFQLGRNGPSLRFGSSEDEAGMDKQSTLCAPPEQQPALLLDAVKLDRDVNQITEEYSFQRVLSTLKQLRGERSEVPPEPPEEPRKACWMKIKKLVAVHSYRGGTGKSNITTNLAALVARAGNRVGVIDTDISSPGIHVIFGLRDEEVRFALNDYLWGRAQIDQAAHDVTASLGPGGDPGADRPRIYLVPSSVKTTEIARVLREGYDVGLLNDGFQHLGAALRLDYLFIDTHPGVNEETLLSIAVSDLALLILRPDNQDFQGTAVTVELARRLNTRDLRIVINKVPPGMDAEALRQQVESAYQVPVIGMLPLNSEMAKLASSGIFAIPYPSHPFTLGLQPVVDLILS